MSEYIGEVVESATKGFIARSRRVGESPVFGSFVKAGGDAPVYGLVYEIITDSKEPGRKNNTYDMTIEELRREQPQVFELLKTDFHVLTVAYSEKGRTRFSLPPLPPHIHSFVYECTAEEILELTSEDFFLRAVISSQNAPIDDLLIASLRLSQEVRAGDSQYVVNMGKSLARFFKDDYERLTSVLRRIA